jgi:hypothetical protein
VFGFNVTGPSGSNVVIQASTDLQTWIPLQTNLLGSGPLYFSDTQSTTNVHRFFCGVVRYVASALDCPRNTHLISLLDAT